MFQGSSIWSVPRVLQIAEDFNGAYRVKTIGELLAQETPPFEGKRHYVMKAAGSEFAGKKISLKPFDECFRGDDSPIQSAAEWGTLLKHWQLDSAASTDTPDTPVGTDHNHDDLYYRKGVVDQSLIDLGNQLEQEFNTALANHTHDGRYYLKQQVDDAISNHNHDGRYYLKSEVDQSQINQNSLIQGNTTEINKLKKPVRVVRLFGPPERYDTIFEIMEGVYEGGVLNYEGSVETVPTDPVGQVITKYFNNILVRGNGGSLVLPNTKAVELYGTYIENLSILGDGKLKTGFYNGARPVIIRQGRLSNLTIVAGTTVILEDVEGIGKINTSNPVNQVSGAGNLILRGRTPDITNVAGSTVTITREGLGGTTIPATAIENLTEVVQDIVGALIVQGNGALVSYNDNEGKLTVGFDGVQNPGGEGVDAEAVRDILGFTLKGFGVVSVVADDANNTVTVYSSATQNQPDSYLLNRANHYNTVPASVVTGLGQAAYTNDFNHLFNKPPLSALRQWAPVFEYFEEPLSADFKAQVPAGNVGLLMVGVVNGYFLKRSDYAVAGTELTVTNTEDLVAGDIVYGVAIMNGADPGNVEVDLSDYYTKEQGDFRYELKGQGGKNYDADIAALQQRIDTLVNGAPAALDTLQEIADQIANDQNGVAGILARLQAHDNSLQNHEGRIQANTTTINSLLAALGNMGMLLTGDKSSFVAAINELKLRIDNKTDKGSIGITGLGREVRLYEGAAVGSSFFVALNELYTSKAALEQKIINGQLETGLQYVFIDPNGNHIVSFHAVRANLPGAIGTRYQLGSGGASFIAHEAVRVKWANNLLSWEPFTATDGGEAYNDEPIKTRLTNIETQLSTQIFYVSPNGNDANTGLATDQAWATIARVNAATEVGPGDSVAFFGGVEYQGTLLPKAGQPGRRISYTSYGGQRATIVGSAANGCEVKQSNCILFELNFKGINQTPLQTHGVFIAPDTTAINNILISNCNMFEFGGMGLYGYPTTQTASYNIVVAYCEFHDNQENGCSLIGNYDVWPVFRNNTTYMHHCKAYRNTGYEGKKNGHTGSGIIIGSGLNSVIEYCEAYDNGGFNGANAGGPMAIWMFDCLNCKIQYCEAHHQKNGRSGTARVDGGGFDIDGGCEGCIVQYCYSHDNDGCGQAFLEYGSANQFKNNHIRFNISINDARCSSHEVGAFEYWTAAPNSLDCFCYNNLFYQDNASSITFQRATIGSINSNGNTIQNLQVFNNIFVVNGQSLSIYNSATTGFYGTYFNNIYFAVNGADLNFSPNGITSDPKLWKLYQPAVTVGATVHDNMHNFLNAYQLKANSPAVKVGYIPPFPLPERDFFGVKYGISPGLCIGPHNVDAIAIPAGVQIISYDTNI
jgi:hypothetical protein